MILYKRKDKERYRLVTMPLSLKDIQKSWYHLQIEQLKSFPSSFKIILTLRKYNLIISKKNDMFHSFCHEKAKQNLKFHEESKRKVDRG